MTPFQSMPLYKSTNDTKKRILMSVWIIEKPLQMPDWNLCIYGENGLFVYIFSVLKKITQPLCQEFDGLLVNKNKIVN